MSLQVDKLTARGVHTLEMETFHLYDLARCAKADAPIRAAACTIVLAERWTNDFLPAEKLLNLERRGGLACLRALARSSLKQH